MKTKRLIGPTVIILVSTGLLVDSIFFKDSPWSVTNFLSKVLAILFTIFGIAFTPAVAGWMEKMALPLLALGLVAVSLAVAVGRAKNAMSKATPAADTPLFDTESVIDTFSDSAHSSENFSSISEHKWSRVGLLVRFTGAFAAVAALFGVAACIIVYSFYWRASEKELKARVDAIGTSIAEIAARQMTPAGITKLSVDLERYRSDGSVAYIYVEDAQGRIVGHTPRELPRYLRRDFPASSERALAGLNLNYRDTSVFEIAKALGPGGGGGFVHVAYRREFIDEEARRVLGPITGAIFAVLIVAVGLFFVYVNRSINRPFFELVEHANRISKGEFAVQLGVARQDELGEIARSLERLRSSLRAMLTRLERGPSPKP